MLFSGAMSTRLKVALVQQSCTADREQNLQTSIEGIEEAANQGAELVVLPELHGSLYFCQKSEPRHFDLAEPIPGPTTDRLCGLARATGCVIVGSVFERRAEGIFHNTAVVIEKDGSVAGTYRKMHIPHDPGYCEKYYFTPGDSGFVPIDTSVGRLGVLVCWDQWFPEAARLMALAGAEVLIYPTAIGWDPADSEEEKARQLDAWVTVQRGHAIANSLPVISCNRIGREFAAPGSSQCNDFWGNSFICGPQGEMLARAPAAEATVVKSEIDYSRSHELRRIWPFLRDRRCDAYDGLLRQFID